MTAAEKAEILEKFGKCRADGESRWSEIHTDYIEDKKFIQLGEQDAPGEDKNSGRARIRINKMMQFVKQVSNEMRQTNIAIKVVPVDNGADLDKARVRQGVIRGIERQCNASFSYQYAGEEQVTGGLGAFRIYTKYISDKSFEQTIAVKRILDASSVFYGPANEPDFSDAEWCIVQGNGSGLKAGEVGYSFVESANDAKTWGTTDNPNEYEFWCLKKVPDTLYQFKTGITIFASKVKKDADPELFVQKDGKRLERKTYRRQWYCHKIKAGEIVETNEWPGKYCPIILVLGREVWVDGKRKLLSLCRFAKDAQRLYNYARSAAAERLSKSSLAPWVGAIESIPAEFLKIWQNSHRRPVGFLPYKAYVDGKPMPAPTAPAPIGLDPAIIQETQTSSNELMATTGIYDASLGKQGNETSGIAIRARQREGDVSTYDFQDNLNIAVRHAGVVINDLVPKIIDTPRQVRMVGEDEQEVVIKVNEKSDLAKEKYGSEDSFYLSDEESYDIATEVGASYATKRQENSENLLELMRVSPVAAQALPNQYVRDLDFNGAQSAAEQIERLMNATTPGIVESKDEKKPVPQEVIQAMQKMEQMQAQMSQMAKEYEALKVDKSIAVMDAKTRQFDAQTKRMALNVNNQGKIQAAMIGAKTDLQTTKIESDTDLQIAGLNAAITTAQAGNNGSTETPDSGIDT